MPFGDGGLLAPRAGRAPFHVMLTTSKARGANRLARSCQRWRNHCSCLITKRLQPQWVAEKYVRLHKGNQLFDAARNFRVLKQHLCSCLIHLDGLICFPGTKSHPHTNDCAAPLWTKSHRHTPPSPPSLPPPPSTSRHPAKPKPTGTRMTPAHSRCFSGAKSLLLRMQKNDGGDGGVCRWELLLRTQPAPRGLEAARRWDLVHRGAESSVCRLAIRMAGRIWSVGFEVTGGAGGRVLVGFGPQRRAGVPPDTNDRASVSLRLCGPNPTTRPPAPGAGSIRRSKSHRHACRLRQAKSHQHMADPSLFLLLSWSQTPPAHGPLWTGMRPPSPRRWLHPQKQIPPARTAVTSILAAFTKPNPTGIRLTMSWSQIHRHTDDRASLSLRLCKPNPTSRHLGAGCNSAGTVTDSQGRPGNSYGKPHAASRTSRFLGAGCNSAGTLTDSQA